MLCSKGETGTGADEGSEKFEGAGLMFEKFKGAGLDLGKVEGPGLMCWERTRLEPGRGARKDVPDEIGAEDINTAEGSGEHEGIGHTNAGQIADVGRAGLERVQ